MTSVWVESLGRSHAEALNLLAAALRECPEELWEAQMWPVADPGYEPWSTPWSVAWHALECLDYDLTGEFGPWSPPAPVTGIGHWQLTTLPRPWTKAELSSYIDHCRGRVRDTLAGMTEEGAARPLPEAHRHHGRPHAWLLTSMAGHTIEHAAQIRQFITTAAGVPATAAAAPRPAVPREV